MMVSTAFITIARYFKSAAPENEYCILTLHISWIKPFVTYYVDICKIWPFCSEFERFLSACCCAFNIT